jgi:small-conductance mechanosensitive channel
MVEELGELVKANAALIASRGAAAAAVLVLITVITLVAARLVERALRRRGPRATTLATIVRSVLTLSGLAVAGIMALAQLGVDVATVIAGAGVLGLAVGFGAQTLVKDCISGFFLILDDVIQVGDVAQVDDKTGTVERVGLRVTQVRAYSGQLWYLPNGSIEKVGNFNREWNRAEVVVGIAYEAEVGRALAVLEGVGAEWAAENPELSLDKPEAQGVLELGDSSVSVRLVAKIPAGKIWEVERELRRRAKKALDSANVEIAYPKRVLYMRSDDESAAPDETPDAAPESAS